MQPQLRPLRLPRPPPCPQTHIYLKENLRLAAWDSNRAHDVDEVFANQIRYLGKHGLCQLIENGRRQTKKMPWLEPPS